ALMFGLSDLRMPSGSAFCALSTSVDALDCASSQLGSFMAMYFIASIALPYPFGLYNVPHCNSVPGINPPVSTFPVLASLAGASRSEERRGGEGGRSLWAPDH